MVSLGSGERKGLATMKGGSRGGQLIGTSPSSGSRLVVDVMSYRKRRMGIGEDICLPRTPTPHQRSWVLCRPQRVFLPGAQVGCGAEIQVGANGPVSGCHLPPRGQRVSKDGGGFDELHKEERWAHCNSFYLLIYFILFNTPMRPSYTTPHRPWTTLATGSRWM